MGVLLSWLPLMAAVPPSAAWSRTTRITWRNAALIDAMDALNRQLKVSLVIDRRVDPEMRLNLSAAEGKVSDILGKGLAPHGLALFTTGSLGYIAPHDVIESLSTLLEAATQRTERLASRQARTALGKIETITVPLLADPRETLTHVAQKRGLTFLALDTLPHDRWRETVFPSLPFAHTLTLILVGFDATWGVSNDGKTITIEKR